MVNLCPVLSSCLDFLKLPTAGNDVIHFPLLAHLGTDSQEFDSTVASLQDDSRTQPTVLQAMLLSLGEM